MMELTNPGLLWLSMGVLLFVMEMAVPGFILFFFGVAAWITALACYLFPVTLDIQLAIFLGASLISLFGLRGIVKKVFTGDAVDSVEDSIMADGGEKCEVTVSIIPPAEGQVKFSGTFWRAEANEQIDAGEVVEIVKQDGLLISVQKIS